MGDLSENDPLVSDDPAIGFDEDDGGPGFDWGIRPFKDVKERKAAGKRIIKVAKELKKGKVPDPVEREQQQQQRRERHRDLWAAAIVVLVFAVGIAAGVGEFVAIVAIVAFLAYYFWPR